MSFGGAVAAMNNSIKNNRALAKRRNVYKEKAFGLRWDESRQFAFKKSSSYDLAENRKNNLAYIKKEKLKSRVGLFIASLISLTFLIIIFQYFF